MRPRRCGDKRCPPPLPSVTEMPCRAVGVADAVAVNGAMGGGSRKPRLFIEIIPVLGSAVVQVSRDGESDGIAVNRPKLR